MKILLNDKELSNYLVSLIDISERISKITVPEESVKDVVGWALERKIKGKELNGEKLFDKISKAVNQDLRTYIITVKEEIQVSREFYHKNINKNAKYFIERFGEEFLITQYKNSKVQHFCKSVGFQIDKNAIMLRREKYSNNNEDVILRNTVGNEHVLIEKIDNKLPFWFIDSGYTNFLEPNKKWHRLTRNHLHHLNHFDAPVDRLNIFPKFPEQWRAGGDKILIVEPGPFAAGIFHVNLKTWKYEIEKELRKYTDKKIVFREKTNKKIREDLYKHLKDEDYYCTISINSNSATESIWAGVPAITLDKHISNSVTKNKLSDINNLYRGSLANWLAILSYGQFTYEELLDGTALKLVRKYNV
jgi:hypothetical protein